MNTTTLDMKVHDFLAQKRIAVAGASRANSHHPAANLIYHRLKNTGHDVFAVNPHMQAFEGDPCYPDLQSIPGGVDGVVIITPPETTERIVHDCSDAGVRRDPPVRWLGWIEVLTLPVPRRAVAPRRQAQWAAAQPRPPLPR